MARFIVVIVLLETRTLKFSLLKRLEIDLLKNLNRSIQISFLFGVQLTQNVAILDLINLNKILYFFVL